MAPYRSDCPAALWMLPLIVLACMPVDDERELHPLPPQSTSGGAGGSGGGSGTGGAGSGGSSGSSGVGRAGSSSEGSGGSSGATTATASGGIGGTANVTSASGGSGSAGGSTGGGGSEGGAPDAGGGVGGSHDAGGTGGAGGTGITTNCPDLDHNAIPDCEETLLDNAGLDTGLKGWSAQAKVTVLWLEEDGAGDDDSGAMVVVNENVEDAQSGITMLGVEQCIPAAPGALYLFLGQLKIEPAGGQGWAGLHVLFYKGAGCVGDRDDDNTAVQSTLPATSGWTVIEERENAPPNVASMRVRLVVSKLYIHPPFAAGFDNLLVKRL